MEAPGPAPMADTGNSGIFIKFIPISSADSPDPSSSINPYKYNQLSYFKINIDYYNRIYGMKLCLTGDQ